MFIVPKAPSSDLKLRWERSVIHEVRTGSGSDWVPIYARITTDYRVATAPGTDLRDETRELLPGTAPT
jgi:hypothetical protein